jgi:uncharacterized protein (TIGR03118 family)
MNVSRFFLSCSAVVMVAAGVVPATAQVRVDQTNLVSDIPGLAKLTDPSLVNAWGIAESPTSPFWIADNGTGLATIYSVPPGGSPTKAGFFVTVPPATGAASSAPTGQVFNGSGGGFNLKNGSSAVFLFASEDGAISGWNPALGFGPGAVQGLIAVDNGNADPLKNAVYKGLAIDNTGGSLFATNFRSGMVEMYNNSFGLVKTISDPTLPAGYAPFGARVLDGKLYVTFALQNATKHDDVGGAGHGFVDTFDLSGGSMQRLITNGALDSPWGLEIAPSSFGSLAGDLLVGNFGDGMINAYNPTTGAFVSTLDGTDGKPLVIDGLWGLTIGNGSVMGGSLNSLYFTAGPNGEANGLFGSLTAVPEPSTWAMLLLGFAGLGLVAVRRRWTPLATA